MKIAVISSRLPYPLEKGDKLRLFHQITRLSDNHEVKLFAVSEFKNNESGILALKLSSVESKVYYLPIWRRAIRLILNFKGTLPFQVAYFYHPLIEEKMKKDIAVYAPDIIYCQLIRASEYARNRPFPKVLDYMDAFSSIARKNYLVSGGIAKWFYRKESERVKNYESEVSRDFDGFTIISQRDKEAIFGEASPVIIPNGIDTDYFSELDYTPSHDMVFVGNLGYGPNIEACRYIVRQILPEVLKSRTNASVLLAGARPSGSLKLLRSKHVKISGWVEDIRTAYRRGRVFVAPIYSGAGLQNKILEAMALGIPCVTTTQVNQAIGAQPGIHLLVAESPKQFSHYIQKLLNEKYFYNQIKKNALEFVRREFQWSKFNGLLESYLIEMAQQPIKHLKEPPHR